MWDAVGNFLGSAASTGAQLYGQQNAGEAISKAATAGIGEANATQGTVNNIWKPQQALGQNADTALSSSLGIGGQPADYSNFMNMPGYKFAVQQGTQAAERQAAAMGNAGNSGTSAMIGNQVTGTAMQDYNTYIGQLYQAAGLGSTANQGLQSSDMQTAGNVEHMNSGLAQARMYTGMGQTAAGGRGGGGYGGGGYGGGYGGGPNGGGVGGLVGGLVKGLGGWLGGGSNTGPNTGTNSNGGYYDAGGGYIGAGGPAFNQGSAGDYYGNMNTGYDNSQTDYSQSAGDYGGPG
jgi:hypothetical protein